MRTIVKEAQKVKKQPAVRKSVKKEIKIEKPENNFYTYTQMVEKKAYELYQKRGGEHGRDREDWLEAEKLIEEELQKQ